MNGELERLSPRERQILALLAEGLSNKETAAQLGLRPTTVKGYVESILHRLGAESRTAAAAIWLQHLARQQREHGE